MREKIEYFLVLFIIKLTKFMPKSWVYFIVEKISIMFFYTLKRRNLAINNLQNALNLNQEEAKKLQKRALLA